MLQILTTILKIIFLDKSVEKNKLQIISIMKILWPNVLYVYLLKFAFRPVSALFFSLSHPTGNGGWLPLPWAWFCQGVLSSNCCQVGWLTVKVSF